MSKYLDFILLEQKKKTNVWNIISKSSGESLGNIKWFPRWRQYTFFPHSDTVWNKDCLNDIMDVLSSLMKQRKENKIPKNLTDKQKETFKMLISKGAIHHKEDGVDNCVWFMGRCLLISKDGTYEDL